MTKSKSLSRDLATGAINIRLQSKDMHALTSVCKRLDLERSEVARRALRASNLQRRVNSKSTGKEPTNTIATRTERTNPNVDNMGTPNT